MSSPDYDDSQLLGLFLNVQEEGLAAPLTNEHNEEDQNLCKVHGHCGSAAQGVKVHFISGEAKLRWARAKWHQWQQEC